MPPTGASLNVNPNDISLGLTIVSAKIAELDVGRTIYMEVDAFNWIDEITPFSIATTDAYNGDFNGSVNNAFAKLALTAGCYVPVKKFKRVLPHAVEKVGRLKIKFRYHNGIPVDFKLQAFDFSLKFECRF
jgi:ribosomal protein L9